MRHVLMVLCLAVTGAAFAAHPTTTYDGPIIDVHVHAGTANMNGPTPNAICAGFAADLGYDPAVPWPVFFTKRAQNPICPRPIWGPETDEGVRDGTIAVMERLNITGVLSGAPDQVDAWRAAAPGRFIRGYALNIERDRVSAADVRRDYEAGRFDVLAEVTNQYSGVLADDPRFADYWQVAADLDIPVGIHLGIGPPGSPMLFDGYRIQSPLRLETVLNEHPTLRVYVMHAGWPFVDDLLAMLYSFPQLHVDTGVLQAGLARAEYYDLLKTLVRAGYGDRILFGSDQMNWPGLIEEGVRAINEAPFLSLEQKRAILYDNAVRFLRLDQQEGLQPPP